MNTTASQPLYQAVNVCYHQWVDGYFIHLNGTTVRIGFYNGAQPPKFLTEDLLPTAVSRSRIIDPQEFCKELTRILAVHYGDKLPRLPIFYILEPELTELFLLTGNKNGSSDEENDLMEKQISDRLVDEKPDELYFAQYKIAPFIYQFVGIKKDLLDPILESGALLGLEIGGILPLGLVLAKTNADVSSMFVFPNGKENTVVFSELTGVTFAEKFGGKLSVDELKELFWKLSVYNTKHGTVNIYTFSKQEQILGSEKHLVLDGGQKENNKDLGFLEDGFEEVDLVKKTLDKNPTVITSQANLINIIPVPAVVQKNNTPVVVGVSMLSFVLIAGLALQLTVGLDSIFGKKTAGQKQEVLSEQEQVQETQTQTPEPSPTPQVVQKDLKRTDLKLKVENGNGVPGSAGKINSYLEGLGYKVGEAGNADKSNYAKTQIVLPKELADYKELLVNDLKTNYSVEVVELDTKPTDYDVLIIVGLE